MGVKVVKKFDLGKIKFDLSKELNLAGQTIRKDHFQRLEKGKGVKGTNMRALKPSTIKRKGSSKIFVDTGKMRNLVIKKANKNNQVVEISPGKKAKRNGVTNQEIGSFHQFGTDKMAPREWFGISKKSEVDAIKMVEMRIEEELRRA